MHRDHVVNLPKLFLYCNFAVVCYRDCLCWVGFMTAENNKLSYQVTVYGIFQDDSSPDIAPMNTMAGVLHAVTYSRKWLLPFRGVASISWLPVLSVSWAQITRSFAVMNKTSIALVLGIFYVMKILKREELLSLPGITKRPRGSKLYYEA